MRFLEAAICMGTAALSNEWSVVPASVNQTLKTDALVFFLHLNISVSV